MVELIRIIVEVIQLVWGIIYQLLPLKATVVREGDGAVRMTWGKPGVTLGAGLKLATTGQTFESGHIKLRFGLISTISITLADGVPLLVNGVFTFQIRDLGRWVTASEDSDTLISEFAEAALREVLVEQEWGDFHREYDELDALIRAKIQHACDEARLGVKVKYFRINSFTIEEPLIRRAVAVKPLVDALHNVPDEECERPGFMGRVALLSGAEPVIPASEEEYE